MNAEIAKVWCDALRHGGYRKGKGQLLNGGSYCCLGVLCELHREANPQGKWESTEAKNGYVDPLTYRPSKDDAGSDIFLPETVKEWAGLADRSPRVTAGLDAFECVAVGGEELSHLNDGEWQREDAAYPKPLTFGEIADLIEKNVASL